jgi:hypothetical protein
VSTRLFEIANPAAVGWEWTTEGGTVHQISWTRGSHQLNYGTRGRGCRNWTNTLIVAPERFGFDGTLNSARAAAQAFVDESEVKA